MTYPEKLDKAQHLLDKVIPKYLELSGMSIDKSTGLFIAIFKDTPIRLVNHLEDQWRDKEGEFGRFYLNLDDAHRRMLLEYWQIDVEPERYHIFEDRMIALMRGEDKFLVYAFETQILHQFLLLANNRSIEEVRKMAHGDLLYHHLRQSKVNAYGTGINWGKYYHYLLQEGVAERKAILEYSYNFR